jgi:NADH:ubiquinone oxidoreductase subunit K
VRDSPIGILTLLSISFILFALLIGALTFGSDREINAEVVAIKFVCVVAAEDGV